MTNLSLRTRGVMFVLMIIRLTGDEQRFVSHGTGYPLSFFLVS